jgi:hypothetical protein
VESLDRVLAEKRIFKKIPGELMRRWAHQHAIGFCQGLKSSRQIWRVTDDGLLSGHADAGCFTYNDETGRDSHTALQRLSVRLF